MPILLKSKMSIIPYFSILSHSHFLLILFPVSSIHSLPVVSHNNLIRSSYWPCKPTFLRAEVALAYKTNILGYITKSGMTSWMKFEAG